MKKKPSASQLTAKQKLGKLGEKLAEKLLLKKGYKFITANFKSKFGEIDLIFEDQGELIFVEVKTRVGDDFGPPEEAITPYKIRHLIKAASYFQLKQPHLPEACRLDVICVQFDEITHKLQSINYYKNITL